jgi:hypothetical protein
MQQKSIGYGSCGTSRGPGALYSHIRSCGSYHARADSRGASCAWFMRMPDAHRLRRTTYARASCARLIRTPHAYRSCVRPSEQVLQPDPGALSTSTVGTAPGCGNRRLRSFNGRSKRDAPPRSGKGVRDPFSPYSFARGCAIFATQPIECAGVSVPLEYYKRTDAASVPTKNQHGRHLRGRDESCMATA